MPENNSKIAFTNARLLAVQVLYAHEMGEENWDKLMSKALLGELGGEVLTEKEENRVKLPAADAGLFTRIVKSYQENAEPIDAAIKSGLSEKIAFDRLELTFLCVLRAGMAEFYADAATDTPVIVNEYVDLTRSFFEGPEVKIANAVLDRFAKVIRG